MFLQVRRPALLDFDGPLPESFKLPKLPHNFVTNLPPRNSRMLRSSGLHRSYIAYMKMNCCVNVEKLEMLWVVETLF
jgi:hypothetical protein